MAGNDDVVWRIGGDTRPLEEANKRAVLSFRKMARQARTGVNQLGKAGLAAAAAAGTAAAAVIKHNLAVIDSQAKMAHQLKTSSASMAVFQRATELTGLSMKQLFVGARTLEIRIGEAQQGVASAADAFKAMKLNVDEVAALPIDERLNTINKALLENVRSTERAAIANDLFGTRAATAMKLLDSDTLKRAREETERWGLALTEIEAAQVEHVNDTLSEAMLIFKGLGQQLTVKVAPILDAIGRLFIDNAKQAGNFGEQSSGAMESVINGAAFVVDAIEGIKRVFSLVADGIVAAAAAIKAAIMKPFVDMTALASKLPGSLGKHYADLNKRLTEETRVAVGTIGEAWQNIKDTVAEPLPGGQFKKFVAEAQEASLTAAEAMVAAQNAIVREAPAVNLGGSGSGNDELQKNLERIREANSTELELLQEKLAAEIEIIAQSKQQKLLTEEDYQSQLTATTARFEKGRTALEKTEADRREAIAESEKQARSSILQGLTTLMNSESRKMFEVGKAAAITQAVINTYNAATGAYSAMASIPYVGPALGAAAAAAAIATGLQQVQAIRSQSFGKSGSPAAASTTANVNAQSTPVGAAGGGGGGGERSQRLYVEGDFDEGSFFSGARVAAIAKQLVDFQNDGGEVIVGG